MTAAPETSAPAASPKSADRVEEASQRRRVSRGGHGDRLEGVGVLVVAQHVAGDGAQLVAQPLGEGVQELFSPEGALAGCRDRARPEGSPPRARSASSSLETSRAAWRAMNSAKATLAPVNARGARDSTSSMTAALRPSADERQREEGRFAVLAVRLGVGASEQVGRGQIGDHQPAPGAQHLSQRRSASPGTTHLVAGALPPVRLVR